MDPKNTTERSRARMWAMGAAMGSAALVFALIGPSLGAFGSLPSVRPASNTQGSSPMFYELPAYTTAKCTQGACSGATNVVASSTGSGSFSGNTGQTISLTTGLAQSSTTTSVGPGTGTAKIENKEWIKIDSYTSSAGAAISYNGQFVITWSATLTVGACTAGQSAEADGFLQVNMALQDQTGGGYVGGTTTVTVWQKVLTCTTVTQSFTSSGTAQFYIVSPASTGALTSTDTYLFQAAAYENLDSYVNSTSGPAVSASNNIGGTNGVYIQGVDCYNCP